jgi:CRISPR/Cas system-associated exonuclease Cas4 (RecB family)
MERMLNKSQINLFIQCPLRWKFIHIDGCPSISSPAQERGTRIHKKIEEFYKNMQPDEELKNFIHFERVRAESCPSSKYFYPLFQELKIVNEDIGLKGIIDAIYINPKDNKIIIIDWKTGHYNKAELDNYRLELYLYKELLEKSKLVDEVGYIGIYFTDQDKLFFEKVDEFNADKIHIKINEIRDLMEKGIYEPKKNWYCKSCEFKLKCPLIQK